MKAHTKIALVATAMIVLTASPAAASEDTEDFLAHFAAPSTALDHEENAVTATQKFTVPDTVKTTTTFERGTYTAVYRPKISYPVAPAPISSGFGGRVCASGPCTTFHEGIDFAAGEGAAVKSIAAGVVTHASYDGNHGNHVTVEHRINGEVFTASYSHMQAIFVRPGQKLERGARIGNVGNTGRSYGAHLHFELHVAGHGPVDPSAWFASHDTQPFPR